MSNGIKLVNLKNDDKITDDYISMFENSKKYIDIEYDETEYTISLLEFIKILELYYKTNDNFYSLKKYFKYEDDTLTFTDSILTKNLKTATSGDNPYLTPIGENIKKFTINTNVVANINSNPDTKKTIQKKYKPQLIYPEGIDELKAPIILAIKNEKLIGYLKYDYKTNHPNFIYISLVETHPDYRGQRVCPKLFTQLINDNEDISRFELSNVGGYSACRCYVSSFQENGFLFHNQKEYMSFCELHYKNEKQSKKNTKKNIQTSITENGYTLKNIKHSNTANTENIGNLEQLINIENRDYMVFTKEI